MSQDVNTRPGGETQPGLLPLGRLKKRPDFLRAGRGRKVHTSGFVLQIWNRRDDAGPRVGFTCSKKVGNAVARNRAKRRLREIARLVIPAHGAMGHDYVLIGRAEVTGAMNFAQMADDLRVALTGFHT